METVKIFLIRHSESTQNTKYNFEEKLPDHKVYLTKKGLLQAKKSALFLKKYTEENEINLKNSILWVSPYKRTRQTAEIINKELKIQYINEDISLIEQRFGLFSYYPIEECKKKFPEQFELYYNTYKNDGKFYARLPQGESPFDVALRTRQFIEMLFRDINSGINNHFIVSHGTTIRAFLLSYFHYPPEWFNKEENMENSAIRLIERKNNVSVDQGYIYKGKIKKI